MSRGRRHAVHRALLGSVFIGLAGQGALIVSGVAVARMLGVENRGNLALLTVLPWVMAQLGGLGLPVAATFEIARDPTIARALLRRVAPFAAVQTIVLTTVHAAILVALVGGRREEVQVAAVITIVTIPALIVLQHGLAVLQGLRRYKAFNALRLCPVVLYAGSACILFVIDAGTLPVLATCYTASWLLAAVVTLGIAIRSSTGQGPDCSTPSIARLVRFGTRSVLGSASPSDGSGIDQVVVGLFLSTRDLGLYVVAASFMNLSRLVTYSMGLVAYPNIAARRDAKDADRAVWKFGAVGAAAALLIIVGLELSVGHLVVIFFGPGFAAADGVARLLLLAAFFFGVRRVLSDAARGAGKPMVGTVAEVTSWAVLVPSIAVLAPLLQLQGVASALIVASAASVVAAIYVVRRPALARAASAAKDPAVGAEPTIRSGEPS